MSDSIDVNILLYASDQTSLRHRASREFLARRTTDPEPFCLTWPVVMAYLRIATHPRIFQNLLSPDEALGNIEALLACPQVRVLTEEEGVLQVYREATGQLKV